jgi:uncharacterized protein YqkB
MHTTQSEFYNYFLSKLSLTKDYNKQFETLKPKYTYKPLFKNLLLLKFKTNRFNQHSQSIG